MKIVYYVAHPSQYYIFKKIAENLPKAIEIILAYTDKDVIKSQLEKDDLDYKRYEIGSRKINIFKPIVGIIKKEIDLFKVVHNEKPGLIMGTSVILAHVGWLLKIPVVIINEDDLDIISLSAMIGYPFVEGIISPRVCKLGRYENKTYKYEGYQKLAYLHPNHFSPDIKVAKKYINLEENNFLIRLSALSAHHDIGVEGINNNQVNELIGFLEKFGTVHISSERLLPKNFENYRLQINPLHLHHVLNFCNLLISDSQSMSVEASILGVPSVRISDFAGRISVLDELEKRYMLTFAVKPENFINVIDLIEKQVFIKDYMKIFKHRRDKMLFEKIDVIPFFINTITKVIRKYYPQLS